MLIYSSVLWLEADFEEVVNIAGEWMSHKLKESVRNLHLHKESNLIRNFEGHSMESRRWQKTLPYLQSIVYTHPDQRSSGRQWKTEIGVRQEQPGSEVMATLILSTNEISTRVDTNTLPTRPILIPNWMTKCRPSARTPGKELITLDETNYREILESIQSKVRRHPIILISPTRESDYLVDLDNVHYYMQGVADVIRVSHEVNDVKLSALFGKHFWVRNGSINIIYPEAFVNGARRVPTRRLTSNDIHLLQAGVDVTFEMELLSLVTHWVNLPNSRQHVSFQTIEAQARAYELAKLREEAQALIQNEYIDLLESENKRLMGETQRLADERNLVQAELSAKDVELDKLRHKESRLNQQIQNQKAKREVQRAQVNSPVLDVEVRQAIVNAIEGRATLEEALKVVETLFPERVIILDTALKSAREMNRYSEKDEVLRLLLKLATEYWQLLSDGVGDHRAREVFGGEKFAARESERVERNERARRLRTFTYKNAPVTMWAHLKIGVKDSREGSWRAHFHWDKEDKKLVIGHCGRHLDHD